MSPEFTVARGRTWISKRSRFRGSHVQESLRRSHPPGARRSGQAGRKCISVLDRTASALRKGTRSAPENGLCFPWDRLPGRLSLSSQWGSGTVYPHAAFPGQGYPHASVVFFAAPRSIDSPRLAHRGLFGSRHDAAVPHGGSARGHLATESGTAACGELEARGG